MKKYDAKTIGTIRNKEDPMQSSKIIIYNKAHLPPLDCPRGANDLVNVAKVLALKVCNATLPNVVYKYTLASALINNS